MRTAELLHDLVLLHLSVINFCEAFLHWLRVLGCKTKSNHLISSSLVMHFWNPNQPLRGPIMFCIIKLKQPLIVLWAHDHSIFSFSRFQCYPAGWLSLNSHPRAQLMWRLQIPTGCDPIDLVLGRLQTNHDWGVSPTRLRRFTPTILRSSLGKLSFFLWRQWLISWQQHALT